MTYKGWIIAKEEDKEKLQELGIRLGLYNKEEHLFEDCIVSDDVLVALDPFWGIFI